MAKARDISPLSMGLLHLLPSILIMLAVAFACTEVWLSAKAAKTQVLGASTASDEIKTETRDQRISQLEDALKNSNSGAVKTEIDKLKQ